MVDWKKLGKQALDLTKETTEKGVESFQEWKNDPERLQKIEEEKARKKQEDSNNKEKANLAPLFHKGVHCPYCRSLNVQFMQNKRKGFSAGKAIGGAALTGGIGTLAGFAGKKGKNQWFCTNCNKTFDKK